MISKKNIIKYFISYILIIVIFYFLGHSLYSNWAQVKNYQFSFNYSLLILSVILWSMGYCSLALVWKHIIKKIQKESQFSNLEAIKVYILAEFGKYLPGKIWIIVGKIYLGSKLGLNRHNLLVSSAIDSILSIIISLFVGLVLFLFFFAVKNLTIILFAFIVIICGLICLYPTIFYTIINFLLRVARKNPIPTEMSLKYKDILKFALIYAMIYIFIGISFYVFVASLTHVSVNNFSIIASSFLLAGSFGVVALFSPSGLGIREGVLTFIMQLIVPLPIAIFITLLARIWTTISELFLLMIILIVDKFYVRHQRL